MNPARNKGAQSQFAGFFDEVVRHIFAQHQNEIPDLRRIVVVVPNYHAAQHLAQHLARAAGTPALLLPRMTTFSGWAQSVPVDSTPDTCRAAALYQALRMRRWFQDSDLWGITRELLGLLDELTLHQIVLPQDEEDFLAQLEQAYQARRNAAMQFEARVVHELWYAMSAGGEMSAARAYQQRLAVIAQQAEAPLYVLQSSDPAAPDARFLEAYRARAPVTVFDLREMAARRPECVTLTAALQDSSSHLRDQAEYLREHYPQAALKLRLFGAHSLEEEARAAEVQVRRWLLAGKKNIALVALDRLVARRVRALLERAEVLVRDETGWTLSTLSVSTVLMRWLDALQSDFYHQDLLDLLKSPFIFADQPSFERRQAVYQLEQLVRKHSVASHLQSFLDLAEGHAEVQTALVRLRQAAEALPKGSISLSKWLQALRQSLDILGVVQGLEGDAAGTQLLQSLQTWQEELAQDDVRFSRTEWRHWLAQQLDAGTFCDQSIDSPVLLTSLAATRWRSFDAVVLLGCDAAHLPAEGDDGIWFNDAARGALGLPTRQVRQVQQRDGLLALLAMNSEVLATWQASRNGEKNLLSPFLELLRTLHKLAYGDDLEDKELDSLLEKAQVQPPGFPLPPSAAMPAPALPEALVPYRISPSGYNSLVDCPYQYFVRHALHLNEMDEVREEVEKRDYGEWVHDILHRFHQQFPILSGHSRAALEEALQRISKEVFAPVMERDYLARAWLLRWQQAIPAYLDAQLAGEAEGWRYQRGEAPFELALDDALLLHGRIDRMDVRKNERRVLDYKMMDVNRLRNRLKEAGEDVQLPCYAAACEAGTVGYLSIDKDRVAEVVPPQDLPELAQANIERLREVFAEIRSGAALPAHGVEEACAYCEMRGLCRKPDWSVA